MHANGYYGLSKAIFKVQLCVSCSKKCMLLRKQIKRKTFCVDKFNLLESVTKFD